MIEDAAYTTYRAAVENVMRKELDIESFESCNDSSFAEYNANVVLT